MSNDRESSLYLVAYWVTDPCAKDLTLLMVSVLDGKYTVYGGFSYTMSILFYCIYFFRDTVMMLLRLMDPGGTESRKRRRIQRRVYHL